MTPVSVFQVSNFLSYSHSKIKGPYEKKKRFRPGGHCHMNSQIMENVIQNYLHVYDSALRIYSQRNLNIEPQTIFTAVTEPAVALSEDVNTNTESLTDTEKTINNPFIILFEKTTVKYTDTQSSSLLPVKIKVRFLTRRN